MPYRLRVSLRLPETGFEWENGMPVALKGADHESGQKEECDWWDAGFHQPGGVVIYKFDKKLNKNVGFATAEEAIDYLREHVEGLGHTGVVEAFDE
jgi:hypothetical protein